MDFDHDLGLISSLVTIDTTIAPSLGSPTNTLTIIGTGSLVVPVGSTTEQPIASSGQIRYDSDLKKLMWSDDVKWNPISTTINNNLPSVWITDVIPTTTGIVGQKTYRSFVATNPLIDTATSNTRNVRVRIGGAGDCLSYSPNILINGVSATITESTTTMWFTGYADIVLVDGPNIITATNGMDNDIINIVVSSGGPAIQTITFGAYPGVQTALKLNDTISVNIITDISATSVIIQAIGAAKTSITLPVTAGVANGTITISSLTGVQTITATAYNSLGTAGVPKISGALTLDQVAPSFVLNSTTYASGHLSASLNEQVSVNITIFNFTTVTYSSSQLTIPVPTTYSQIKDVVVILNGYNIANNYTIVANKAANNSSATFNSVVKIASVAPVAAITITGNPARLVSSVIGTNYEIRITPTQTLSTAPTLNASIGTWMGSWVVSGTGWVRNLQISNTAARGTGLFSALTMTNEANIPGTVITSGSNYIVGGFAVITVTFPSFSRVAPMGVYVSTQTKTLAQIVGGNTLVLHTDAGVYSNGYYIANADGTYNQNGNYLGLSDSTFAGANTSGTLQATIQETV